MLILIISDFVWLILLIKLHTLVYGTILILCLDFHRVPLEEKAARPSTAKVRAALVGARPELPKARVQHEEEVHGA